ncbi:MAG TPA: hypothetical protein VFP17_10415 [Solirubrobacterales bacterium]|nr:hypothetical protein [Solirubrobacterales bacterium]
MSQTRSQLENMGQQAAGQGKDGGPNQRNSDAFSETLAPLVGLGDQERGEKEAEVDENSVGFDHAELYRPRPER